MFFITVGVDAVPFKTNSDRRHHIPKQLGLPSMSVSRKSNLGWPDFGRLTTYATHWSTVVRGRRPIVLADSGHPSGPISQVKQFSQRCNNRRSIGCNCSSVIHTTRFASILSAGRCFPFSLHPVFEAAATF
jgi:hypothetical protein